MNATPHTVAGYALVKSIFTGSIFSLIIGCISAFISHIVLDLVNESDGIKTNKQRFWLELLPTIALGLFSIYLGIQTGSWWLFFVEFGLFILGSIFGNMPDIIDKFFYLAILYPKKYKFTYYFHFKIKPPINPPGIVTKAIGWVMVILFMIIYLLITK